MKYEHNRLLDLSWSVGLSEFNCKQGENFDDVHYLIKINRMSCSISNKENGSLSNNISKKLNLKELKTTLGQATKLKTSF